MIQKELLEKSLRLKKIHRRKRKECEGMLVQNGGTPFDWFNIGKKYSLHGYIDDATGKILGLYMCENECLMGYLEITRQMLKKYGSPMKTFIEKHLGILSIVFLILLIGGFAIIKYI